MADVTKIPGSIPPPRRPNEPAKPGTEKFKDLMKIDKSNEEQKKRKKRQEEAEEDTKAALRSGATSLDKPVEGVKKADKFPKIQKVGESEKRQSQQQKTAEEATALEQAAAAAKASSQVAPPLEKVESKPTASAPLRPSIPEETAKEIVSEEIKDKEEEKITFKKQQSSQQAAEAAILPASSSLGPLFIAPAPESAPAYTLLKPEVLALFERMVSQIVIMQTNSVNETTIHLNTPGFASSIFANAQITIREYSTAPLIYNIEFLGTEQNSLYFQQNIPGLQAAFASEKRNFTIHDIKSGLRREEKPLFHRKENPTDENKDRS